MARAALELEEIRPGGMTELADSFHVAMLGIYDAALSETRYRATRFRQLVLEHRGVNAAKMLLKPGGNMEGLKELLARGRPDLTMEALVLQDQWKSLFTEDELNEAKKRLGRF